MSLSNADQNTNIIVFPNIDKLKDEINILKRTFTSLILERDNIKHVVCRNIEMKYTLELGGLEYRAYALNCKMLRLKRKIELIQMKINRQESIDNVEISNILDLEFAEYQENLRMLLEKVNESISRSKSKLLTDDELKEVKALYREIIKKLHPDVLLNSTQEQERLFQNAKNAYESGDIKTLRLIKEMIYDVNEEDINKLSASFITEEMDRVSHLIKDIEEEINVIKNSNPYKLKEIIENKQLLGMKKQELTETIENIEQRTKSYNLHLNNILEKNNGKHN